MANPRFFTPGPWFVHPGSDPNEVQVRVQRTDKPEFEMTVATCGGWGTTAALNAGNAALIAAAPELYAMLERINTAFYTRTSRTEWLALMEETKPLLQKARGAK